MANTFNFNDAKHVAMAVAHLTSLDLRQADIQRLLGLHSQSQVSRNLEAAKKGRLVKTEIQCDDELRKDIERLVYDKEKY